MTFACADTRAPFRSPFGASGRVHPNRAPFEFYPTPPEAVRALLSVEVFDGSIWEPACGDGAISRQLVAVGHDVVSTDFVDHGFGTSGAISSQNRRRARSIS
jgi:hypothetical protein